MVLSSQSSRQSPRSRFMSNSSPRRSRLRVVTLLAGLAVVGTVIYFALKAWSSGPSKESAVKMAERPAPAPAAPAATGGEVTIELPSDQVIGGGADSKPAAMLATPTAVAAAQTQPTNDATSEAAKAPTVPSAPMGVIGASATNQQPASDAGGTGAGAPAMPAAGTMALDEAIAMVDRDPMRARAQLTRLLEGSALSTADRMRGYDAINKVNAVLVFSNRVVNGDPYSLGYKIEPGDSLARIAKAQKLDCDWRLVQRINGISNPNGLKVGQSVKLPRGAFNAEVRKSEYRLNMYMGEGPDRVMIASYPIGLGELNTTPTGAFIVRPKSKLIDPEWRNPRTGEFFQSNDPKNPIGERWIGLKGIEPHNKGFEGYGIHGTIDLESIGQQKSMGCVRMRPLDVEMVYEMLTEPNSTVTIAP
ncbi:MAG: LysM peptidoglycan-binding domain-containing protein [Planctomycetes bacterium]|nr:LysM peptidoglycan-binding domain-containing protein [Planctomycetota bacterium]